MHLTVLPQELRVAPGNIFDVDLTIPEAGSPFNGFDAVVELDPQLLTFIERSQVEQEGPLMTGACGFTFHHFVVEQDGSRLRVSNVLLCPGVSVTGPGVIYRLRFQAGQTTGTTSLRLHSSTAFYDAGIAVSPVTTEDATALIGSETAAPSLLPQTKLDLRSFPNPFNPRTTIAYTLSCAEMVHLAVLSMAGRRIDTLVEELQPAGTHRASWDGRDAGGRRVSSGTYFLHLATPSGQDVRRVTVLE